MEADEVLKIYNIFQKNGVQVWIDGGWSIDALLGNQTRVHSDLDIAVDHKDVEKLLSLLNSLGYNEKDKTSDWNFVLSNEGKEIDIHVFKFDNQGNNIYGIKYPKESLTGKGTINGQTVRCISPEYVIKFHETYEPKEKDLKDMKALCDKFNLELPKNYKINS